MFKNKKIVLPILILFGALSGLIFTACSGENKKSTANPQVINNIHPASQNIMLEESKNLGAPEDEVKNSPLSWKPFGVMNDFKYTNGSFDLTAAKTLGQQKTRLILFWQEVEPRQNIWNFKRADELIAAHLAAGITPLITIKCQSNWATKSPDKSSPPKNMDDYKEFIKKIAERYKDQINYWQIENEVYDNSQYWGGSRTEYIELLKTAYTAIKEINPEAKIVLQGFADLTLKMVAEKEPEAVAFFNYIMQEGYNYFDIIDFHQYYEPKDIYTNLTVLQEAMDKYGQKELISTEMGDLDLRLFSEYLTRGRKIPVIEKLWAIPSVRTKIQEIIKGGVLPAEQIELAIFLKNNPEARVVMEGYQAESLIKRLMITLGNGVIAADWLCMQDNNNNPVDWFHALMCLIDADGRKKPAFYAYQFLISELGDFTEITEISRTPYLFKISASGENPVYIAWSENEQIIDMSEYFSSDTATVISFPQEAEGEESKTVPTDSILISPLPIIIK